LPRYNDLILDDTHFAEPLTIPGITSSLEPYDAPNGALCVNFNTVHFRKTRGTYVSAEPQTPLLPFALARIKKSGLKKGRIIFSHNRRDITRYAGHLFQYFLKQAGVSSTGKIRLGSVRPDRDRLIYRFVSPYSLPEVVSRLMAYSNNFMANQLLISSGVRDFGPPGTLEKGVASARAYAKTDLQIDTLQMVEGSGISRDNRLSAHAMRRVLLAFKPHYQLLRFQKNIYYKTGTLNGISTRAGYIQGARGDLYPFVVFFNTRGKSAEDVMGRLRELVDRVEGIR
jgi:serine-type D-Ala-D-Ala carboxypeptidase/endopeptidase (penicillin-binding protein 4)